VFLNIIVQMVQIGLGLRQNGDSNEQQLKQDTKSNKEELKHEKTQNTKQNQNRREYHKKQSERQICRASDPMGHWTIGQKLIVSKPSRE
jgi:mannitol-specific phosphotransferase system IIBC component